MPATHSKLNASVRTAMGHKNRQLRRSGLLPGNIFGGKGDSLPVQIDALTFERMGVKHETTGLIEMTIAGRSQPETVLVRHIERDPRTGKMIHVDFFRVALNEPIRARVPLRMVGESETVKIQGGMVLLVLESVEIEALPDNLPSAIDVDASKLSGSTTMLHARDLMLPKGVTLRTDPDEPVAKVQQQRGEEVTEAAPAAEAGAEAAPEAAAEQG
jgi:large subunit ribosomal protein L25